MFDFKKNYEAKTAEEAQALINARAEGFAQGYHMGLIEGSVTSRYPERCHCHCCFRHGELCK